MFKHWIDALQFDEKGGWRPETQFVREMGQGYLLGMHLPGIPVEDAATCFRVPDAGHYRIWVRTKNWLRPHGPGRFAALVDGVRVGIELGNLPSERWGWQIAGDAELTGGEHTLSMRDTTGYFPRFSAVIITDDMDYTPSPEWERCYAERAAMLGESGEIAASGPWDVVVVGGGPGGIPAAVAAARSGMRVALVHSRPVLGGNASSEANVGFDGAYIHHPGMREGGIAEEIRRIRDHGQLTWQQALEKICAAEVNLHIFLNQCVIDARTQNGRITAAIAQDTMGAARTAFEGEMFIDATGDGWLGYYAGASYRVGREASWQHGESRAPRCADNRTMSGCLMGNDRGRQMLSYYAEDCGEPSPFCAPSWAQVLPEEIHRRPGRLHAGEWWVENPTDYDDLFEGEMVRDQLIVISLAYFNWLKNHYEKRDLMQNYRITAFPSYNAKRESRRLIGDYVLTEQDCTSGRDFEDTVAYAGWTIDVHNQQGIFSGLAGPYDFDIRVPINQIPYRCLYSKDIENLYMAGRCVSVTHIALGTVRVENTIATMGQAVGTAAAMAVRLGITPREIYKNHMAALQQQLLRDDQYIPGIKNEQEDDLARTAAVSASSYSTTEGFTRKRGIPREKIALEVPHCLVFFEKPEGELSLYLHNTGKDISAHMDWVAVADTTDRQEMLERVEVHIPGGFDGFMPIPRSVSTQARGLGLRLPKLSQVLVRKVEFTGFGTTLARWEPPYWPAARNTSLVHRIAGEPQPPLADCRPEAVINGVSRPLSEGQYAWVSDPAQALPQEITLTLLKPADLSTVQVTFDTDLIHPLYSMQMVPVVPQTVKDYDILIDGEVAQRIRGNIHRMRRHSVQAAGARKVTVRVHATWGDPSARIFEIRLY